MIHNNTLTFTFSKLKNKTRSKGNGIKSITPIRNKRKIGQFTRRNKSSTSGIIMSILNNIVNEIDSQEETKAFINQEETTNEEEEVVF